MARQPRRFSAHVFGAVLALLIPVLGLPSAPAAGDLPAAGVWEETVPSPYGYSLYFDSSGGGFVRISTWLNATENLVDARLRASLERGVRGSVDGGPWTRVGSGGFFWLEPRTPFVTVQTSEPAAFGLETPSEGPPPYYGAWSAHGTFLFQQLRDAPYRVVFMGATLGVEGTTFTARVSGNEAVTWVARSGGADVFFATSSRGYGMWADAGAHWGFGGSRVRAVGAATFEADSRAYYSVIGADKCVCRFWGPDGESSNTLGLTYGLGADTWVVNGPPGLRRLEAVLDAATPIGQPDPRLMVQEPLIYTRADYANGEVSRAWIAADVTHPVVALR